MAALAALLLAADRARFVNVMAVRFDRAAVSLLIHGDTRTVIAPFAPIASARAVLSRTMTSEVLLTAIDIERGGTVRPVFTSPDRPGVGRAPRRPSDPGPLSGIHSHLRRLDDGPGPIDGGGAGAAGCRPGGALRADVRGTRRRQPPVRARRGCPGGDWLQRRLHRQRLVNLRRRGVASPATTSRAPRTCGGCSGSAPRSPWPRSLPR